MKQDKLALLKAVDSGDTELGVYMRGIVAADWLSSLSLPCAPAPAQATPAWLFLPSDRGRGRTPRTCQLATPSVRAGAEQGDAP